ncbi:MAG: hypothetical protein N4A68_11460 [Maledivibacter sp.]|nr:hypothetical protein [Maledivibacter sp.]
MEKHRADLMLKRLRRRIWAEGILNWLINGMLASGIIATLLMAFIHLYPLVYPLKKAVYLLALVMTIALTIGLLQRPKLKDTAYLGDSLGLEDRLITYIEYREENTPLIKVFLEDLEDILKDGDFLKKHRLRLRGKRLFASILMICISLGIYYLPTETRELAKEREEINKIVRGEAQEIKKLLEEDNSLGKDKELQGKARDILEDLERRLKNTYDFNEAAGEIYHAQREIEDIWRKDHIDTLEGLCGALQGASDANKDLKNALKSGDMEGVIKLSKNRSFTDKEQEKMLQGLELEEKRPHTTITKEKLNEIRKDLEKKSFTGEDLARTIKSLRDREALEDLEKGILDELRETKERFIAKSDGGIKNRGGQDKVSTFTQGNKTDLGSGGGSDREGNELLAGGVGNKAMDNTEGVGGGKGFASGKGTDQGIFGEVEGATEANRLGEADGSISRISGQSSKAGNITSKFSNGAVAVEGEKMDLQGALMEYEKEGMKYVYKQNIPVGRRELVMEYFMQINGGMKDGEKDD